MIVVAQWIILKWHSQSTGIILAYRSQSSICRSTKFYHPCSYYYSINIAAYESNLPLPSSGIESLILLVDHRIESLPFETLRVFSKIPVIARDFNLHLHSQRLKSLGHQALIHNNTGLNKESLRYIFDAPQPIEDKCNSFMTGDLPKMMAGAKWEGLLTRQHHVPSEGEWQRYISQSSLFAYFSMTSLVHKFHPGQVSDLSIFSKCRAMIIMDRMNTFKTLVDRNILTSKHYVPNEQPTNQAALFSLCGVSTIVTNNWAIKPEASIEAFQMLLRNTLAEGVYIGAALRKYRANAQVEEGDASMAGVSTDKKLIYRANVVTYGVPIVRVV